jgi:hypothetical protein
MLNSFGQIKDKIVNEVETRVNLVKLGIIERVSKTLSYFIFLLFCIIMLGAILIIAGLGFGEYFQSLTGSYTSGYFLAAGLYALLFALLIAFKKPLSKLFVGIFIKELTDTNDD